MLSFSHRWWWKNLTDVCQRWRYIIFASPHGLDLRLVCTHRTPTRTSLDIWPPFPISISCPFWDLDDEGQDNIIAALEHHDRVKQIDISILRHNQFVFEKFSAMTQPFPILTDLRLSSPDDEILLHEEFLGGSAPCLRTISLRNIGFPAFPKLALSATHLYSLTLWNITMTGYISPEAMATCLATLPSLEFFSIGFQSRFFPDPIGPPPLTRPVLPVLFQFEFEGVSEYLEDLVARIDTPGLLLFEIDLFMDLTFHIPQLHKFIARTEIMLDWPLSEARITFSDFHIHIGLPLTGMVKSGITCEEPDWQASSMAQVCSQLSRLLAHVKRLDILENTPGQAQQGNGINPTRWLELFDPFPAVQHLHVSDELRPLVARVLQGLTEERATEVLPALRSLHLKGRTPSKFIWEGIQAFISARQHSNYPVDVYWE